VSIVAIRDSIFIILKEFIESRDFIRLEMKDILLFDFKDSITVIFIFYLIRVKRSIAIEFKSTYWILVTIKV
jgi:hypothetical protein